MRKTGILILVAALVLTLTIGCSNSSIKSSVNNSNNQSGKTMETAAKATTTATEDLSGYFEGFEGCFVLLDGKKDELTVYNEVKCKKRVPPCSTFKIVNSLIGLETGVLQDENTLLKWDGTKYPIPEWNKDHTLASAVSNSVVWYFQQVAAKIGEERMQSYLNRISYGNMDISGGITKFWLQSSLMVSPLEQVELLRNFHEYNLPFSSRNIDIVKKVLVLSKENGVAFSGKTGSGISDGKGVNGWFVGYVERDNNVYYFAANIEAEDGASGVKAKELAAKILKDKGILN